MIRWLVFAAMLLLVAALPASGAAPKGVPLFSEWIDARYGWASGDGTVHATVDGGRTWRMIFRGGNHAAGVRTSRSAGVVSAGNQAGESVWTNDAGRHWYLNGPIPWIAVAAGRGNLLFWHDWGAQLSRVEGWPPRGDFPCRRVTSDWGPPAPGHPLCAAPTNDAGLRSVAVARLEQGTFTFMRSVPGGVFAALRGTGDRRVAVFRNGTLSVTRLPDAPPGADSSGSLEIAAAWPRLYATVGSALWRSGDGGQTWTVLAGSAAPEPPARARGPARTGARTWLPGGFVASARTGRRRVLMIRQLGRTRLLALPRSAGCSALEPRVVWPQIFVEGRRAGRTVAVWQSPDGGTRWARYRRC